ncbi:helix-turn-helix domain-containing protein [Lacticaseibacillus nasuensis]|uniref:Xre-like DNA-binding protein n=1 Tax=Lacticaseibacillus nasuensis JCM 17158 TaxID=1291734 RepID=A0A0R1JV73_9LACO|nr:helix-turn-helix domain-containing protein [Lacticaseibacillus nasuensis]KRK72601.1 Xre-like DNA-binding protein [Lacticaseibacillus nasuensis JCM 17158]
MDEIGQKLRAARIEKGYTLDDLQQITKIQKRYLIAIEEGNFDQLPGDFYVRAFIKQYAETVGIDSDALLNQFQQDIPDPQPEEYVQASVQNQTRARRQAEHSPANQLRRRLPQLGLLLLGILIVFGVYYITIVKSHDEAKQAIPDDSSKVTLSTTRKKSSAKSSSSAAAKSSSSKKAELTIKAAAATGNTQAVTVSNMPKTASKLSVSATTAAAWVAVVIDNQTTWQASLAAGSSHDVTIPSGTTSFQVRSGNAKATGLKLNGKTVDISNGTSVVRTITFTVSAAD